MKIGNDEFDTIRSLMTMSLYSVLSDVFEIEIDQIEPEHHLEKDLGMSEQHRLKLHDSIMTTFDDFEVNWSVIEYVQDLADVLFRDELDELLEEDFIY